MDSFKKIVVLPSAKIIDVISVIDVGAMQIALVCDENGRFLGTVTDGDVRRAILRKVSLESPISLAMNSNPIFVTSGTEPKQIQILKAEKKIRHVPVVDENHRLVGLDYDSRINEPLIDVAVVIMAGGEGKRLYPLTKEIPKPMIKVGDKPMLELVIDNLIECGVRQFFISVNYKAEMIKDYFRDGQSRDISISYLEESTPMGTAGSLALLPDNLKGPFIVMNADVLTKVNFKKLVDFHSKKQAMATMCLKSFELDVPYGVVELDGVNIENIDEKPVQKFLVNAGIYVLDPEIKKYLNAAGRLDMPTLYMSLKEAGAKVVGFPIHEYWLDVGRRSDLDRAVGDAGAK